MRVSSARKDYLMKLSRAAKKNGEMVRYIWTSIGFLENIYRDGLSKEIGLPLAENAINQARSRGQAKLLRRLLFASMV